MAIHYTNCCIALINTNMDEITAKKAFSKFDDYLDICLGFGDGSKQNEIYKKKKKLKEDNSLTNEEFKKADAELFWEYLKSQG